MHITRERFKPTTLVAASDKLIEGASRAYLERHQPVGGRDTWTTSLLAQHGVQSYFSGCVTLTLGTGVRHPSQDYVCAVDLDEELFGSLTLRTRTPILRLRHSDPSGGTFEERCGRAAKLLSTYAHAKAVVTSRLHCALPCIAFGTPVLFIAVAPDAYRFSGLTELIRGCDAQAFKQGNVAFDADNPSANADRHLELRNRLVARLEAFTGTRMRPFQPQGPSELFSSA